MFTPPDSPTPSFTGELVLNLRLLSPAPAHNSFPILSLHAATQSYFTGQVFINLVKNGNLFSRHPSCLDAFSIYDLPRSCGACSVEQPLTRGDRALFLSYWTHAALKFPTTPLDRIRPVSRRSKPSSRSLLMGVQPHPWTLLHVQDRKSRHRGSKPQGRYELLPATTLLPPG